MNSRTLIEEPTAPPLSASPLPSTRFSTAVSDRHCDRQSDRQNEVGDAEEADSYRVLETRKNTKHLLSAVCPDEVDEGEFTELPA